MVVEMRRSRIRNAVPTVPIRPFSVPEYRRLIEVGILQESDRCELLDGWIVPKMSINPRHSSTIRVLTLLFFTLLPRKYIPQFQMPITLDRSEPEPDLAVIRGPEERYDGINPSARDCLLVAEVAESSLMIDRDEKLRLYAEAKIPEYWIVNLIERQVEVFTRPRRGRLPGYLDRHIYRPGESIPLILENETIAEIPVSEILPERA